MLLWVVQGSCGHSGHSKELRDNLGGFDGSLQTGDKNAPLLEAASKLLCKFRQLNRGMSHES